MQRWLFKSEPSSYSISDLERDATATWDGISNAMARIHLRNVKKGDLIFFYHTGKERAIVGIMEATSGGQPDARSKDAKAVVVQVAFRKAFMTPVTLEQIKKDRTFTGWDLIKQSRLSVMPVSEKQWRRIVQLVGE
jgi:predicted RNA-binding protein with PUA-like domain